MTASYDLVHQPWIRLRTTSGAEEEWSLLDTLTRAHEVVALAGELPTTDVAITRHLLAVLRRSHSGARGTEAWGRLWRAGQFDGDRIASYLEQHRGRFDLLHPTTPFLQVPDLATAKGEVKPVRVLIADVPTKHLLFTTRAGDEMEELGFAEAARWLVHCQAYDISGIKSGALGDPRVKGGKGYPIGKGWCGELGAVLVQGSTLFQTLLLNWSMRSDEPTDTAVWEREPLTAAPERTEGAAPTGVVDLLTWPSRRIRLDHDGERVTGVLVANGDPLHGRNRFREEHMTGWRRSEAQMKKLGTTEDVWMPRSHSGDRQVWRGLEGLLAESLDGPSGVKAGEWLEWLSRLRADGELEASTVVRVRTVGVEYGPQDSTYADVFADGLTVPAAVLGDRRLRRLAVQAVAWADDGVRQVVSLAAELAEAAGLSGTDALAHERSRARELAYHALDQPFRVWLRTLNPSAEEDHLGIEWRRAARHTLRALGRELVAGADASAWTGRPVDRGKDTVLFLDAGLAENRFLRGLRRALPLPDVNPDGNPERTSR